MSDQKFAIVTGGTRGIGAEIAKLLDRDGFKVCATYLGNENAAEAFRKSCPNAMTMKFDVSDYQSCVEAYDKIKAECGGEIAVLVNNAGITKDGVFHKMTPEAWGDVMMTNLNSCFNMTRVLINDMRNNGHGRIINISSINGQKGQFGQTNYAAAKAGIIGFTKSLALENAAKGITVNAICPGYIETDMTSGMDATTLSSIVTQIPEKRLGKPSEIAELVSYVASDKAAFMTGAVLPINGGQYMT